MTEISKRMRVTRGDGRSVDGTASTIWATSGRVYIGIDESDDQSAIAHFSIEQAMAIMAQLGAAIVEAQEQEQA